MTVIGFPTYFFKSASSEPQRLSKIILYNRVPLCIQIRSISKLCVCVWGGGGEGGHTVPRFALMVFITNISHQPDFDI